MSFRILFVTSTAAEAEVLGKLNGFSKSSTGFSSSKIEIDLLIGGVGSISTAWAMKQWLSVNKRPDLAINAGIAGSFKDDVAKGEVVMPVTDCFADSGIEDRERFLTLSEAGLAGADEFPFKKGLLHADNEFTEKLKELIRPVSAITVNTASGSAPTIDKLIKKYNPDIETMEGATFFYICIWECIPFLALRSISNKVEPRNKNNWNIALALGKLSEKLNEVLITF
jgi:futalosine hydrolase